MHPALPIFRDGQGALGFSLIEVALALGVCAVGIIGVMGLFSSSIQVNRKSQDQIQAANLASLLVSARTSSPTNAIARFAIPSLASAYAGTTNFVGYDGTIAASSSQAVYRMVCEAGTNSLTGTRLAQLHLLLSWPPQVPLDSPAAKRYEILTYIPLP